MMFVWKKIALLAGGVVLGSLGTKVLAGKCAKKAYVHGTAAVLRAKDVVMDGVTKLKENAEDLVAEAEVVNKKKEAAAAAVAKEVVIEDCADVTEADS